MTARIAAMALGLGALLLTLPAGLSPVEEASAYCVQIEGVDDCFNPCMEAAGAYNGARQETGTEDTLPPAYCVA